MEKKKVTKEITDETKDRISVIANVQRNTADILMLAGYDDGLISVKRLTRIAAAIIQSAIEGFCGMQNEPENLTRAMMTNSLSSELYEYVLIQRAMKKAENEEEEGKKEENE